MLLKWSSQVTEMLSQLEAESPDANLDNKQGIKTPELDFDDLDPEIVKRAAPTIQFSVSTVKKDEVEEPVRCSPLRNTI